jgi:transcriptional regulator with XRE-family HTH domain
MTRTLREWRTARLLSLDDLAAKAGVSNKTLVQIEHGRQQPRYRTMRRLCAALGIDDPRQVAEFAAVLAAAARGPDRPGDGAHPVRAGQVP